MRTGHVDFFRILMAALCCFFTTAAFAQHPQVSAEPHNGKVVKIVPTAQKDGFYSAGEDGFLIKWSADGMGEHYQITDLKISDMAVNPANNDVAVSASDGNEINRVEVMDWATASKKFTKQFSDPILSISYSTRGRFLFITTSGVNGFYILNAMTGKLLKQSDSPSEKISMIATSNSEKAAILYSEKSGKIFYFDMQKLVVQKTLSTSSGIKQTVLFGEKYANRFIAGVKGGLITILDAKTASTVCSISATSPRILVSQDNSKIYYTSTETDGTVLYELGEEKLGAKIEGLSNSVTALEICKFSNSELPGKSVTSCADIGGKQMLFGTSDGTVYEAKNQGEKLGTRLLTKRMYQAIRDITSFNKKIYLLTKDGIYRVAYDGTIVKVGENSGHTDLIIADESTAVLWSKKDKKSVQVVSLSETAPGTPRAIFAPKSNILNAHVFDRNFVYVLASSKVGRLNLDNSKNVSLYSGTTVEDAFMTSSKLVYVAKSASGEIDSALISKNLSTGETVPLKVDGYASFAVDADMSEDKNIYGLALADYDGNTVTQVYQYYPAQRKSKVLLRFNAEDMNAFVQLESSVLYTNLGKSQIYAYELDSGKVRVYRRTSALPKKMAVSDEHLVFLNEDGGLAWYNPASQTALSQWYLNTEGTWIEF